MKTVQKLEFYSSITVLFAAILQFLLFIFYMPHDEESSVFVLLAYACLFLFLPATTIFIGSYIQIMKKNDIGFVIVLFFGFIFVCFYAFFPLIGFLMGQQINKNAIRGTIIWLFPSFFVICTMIFASINVIKSYKE